MSAPHGRRGAHPQYWDIDETSPPPIMRHFRPSRPGRRNGQPSATGRHPLQPFEVISPHDRAMAFSPRSIMSWSWPREKRPSERRVLCRMPPNEADRRRRLVADTLGGVSAFSRSKPIFWIATARPMHLRRSARFSRVISPFIAKLRDRADDRLAGPNDALCVI